MQIINCSYQKNYLSFASVTQFVQPSLSLLFAFSSPISQPALSSFSAAVSETTSVTSTFVLVVILFTTNWWNSLYACTLQWVTTISISSFPISNFQFLISTFLVLVPPQSNGKGVGESSYSAGVHDQAVVQRGHLGRPSWRYSTPK